MELTFTRALHCRKGNQLHNQHHLRMARLDFSTINQKYKRCVREGCLRKKCFSFEFYPNFLSPHPPPPPLRLGQNKKKTAVFSPETFPEPVTLQMERVGPKYFLSFHSFFKPINPKHTTSEASSFFRPNLLQNLLGLSLPKAKSTPELSVFDKVSV